MTITVLFTIIGIGLVILIHELGHLLAAKRVGILVYEFSIGFGPRVAHKKWGETIYSLRAIPMGGYVRLAGMDDDSESEEVPPPDRSYYNKGFWARFLVIVGGSGMNAILGFVIFTCVYAVLGSSRVTPVIDQVFPNSGAAQAGIVAGDELVAIDQVLAKDNVEQAVDYIHDHPNQPLQVRFIHQGTEVAKTIVPALDPESGHGLVGVELKPEQIPVGFLTAVKLGAVETKDQIVHTFKAVGQLITGKVRLNQMLGPVGIVQVVGFQLSRASIYFLNLLGIITVNIGMLNLFPFPALDGGHLIFLIIEKMSGRTLSKKVVNVVNTVGMALLYSLMVFVLFNDVHQWGSRKQFFKKLNDHTQNTPKIFR